MRQSIRHVRQHFHSHLTTHSTGIIKPSGEFIELISGIPCSFTKKLMSYDLTGYDLTGRLTVVLTGMLVVQWHFEQWVLS